MVETIRVTVDGVSSASANAWIRSTRAVLVALREHPDKVPFTVPAEILEAFSAYIDQWSLAALGEAFRWSGEADAEEIRRLVTYCLNLAMLTEGSLAELGCERMPTAGGAFHEALGRALVAALATAADTASFAEHLAAVWPVLTPVDEERVTPLDPG